MQRGGERVGDDLRSDDSGVGGLFRPWRREPPVVQRIGRNYLVASTLAVAGALTIVLLRDPLDAEGQAWTRIVPGVFGLLPLAVFLPVAWWRARRVRREFQAAAGRLCTHCAYNVGPLGERGTCPECGKPFAAQADARRWSQAGYRSKVAKSAPSEQDVGMAADSMERP